MSKMFTQIASDAFKSIPRGAGMVLSNSDPSKPAKPQDTDILYATTGGITASCVATYSDDGADMDNVPNNTKELKQLDGWECKFAFVAVTMTARGVQLAIGPATVEGNKIAPKDTLELSDFTDKIWWVGDMGDGGMAAISLENVLSSGGLTLKTTKNGKGQLTIELQGHVSITNVTKCPMEFYVEEEIAA